MSDRCENIVEQTSKLDIKQHTKDILNVMISELNKLNKLNQKEIKGGKYKKQKSKIGRRHKKNESKKNKSKKNRLKKGGNNCNYFKIGIILSLFSLALYVNRECLIHKYNFIAVPSLIDSVYYALEHYKKSILNLFNISENFQKFNKGDFSVMQFAVESFGKYNLHNLFMEKITSYYTRITTKKRESVVELLPIPLTNFLNIFCDLFDNKSNTKTLKEELDKTLRPFDPDTKSGESGESVTSETDTVTSDITNSDSETIITQQGENNISIKNLKPGQEIQIHISDNDGFFYSV